MPSLPWKAHLWPGCCRRCWPYRRDSCLGYGCDGNRMVRLDGGEVDGEVPLLSAKHIASVARSKVLWAAPTIPSSPAPHLSVFHGNAVYFQLKLFIIKDHLPPPLVAVKRTLCTENCICTECVLTFAQWHCGVVSFAQRERLIFKRSYSSSSNQGNKAYLEDEVLCCSLLPRAPQNQVRQEMASLILLPLARSLNSHEVGKSEKGRAWRYSWFQALAGKKPSSCPLQNGHSFIWRL